MQTLAAGHAEKSPHHWTNGSICKAGDERKSRKQLAADIQPVALSILLSATQMVLVLVVVLVDVLLTLRWYHIVALLRLREVSKAEKEMALLGDLRSDSWLYERYAGVYPNKSGSMVPLAIMSLESPANSIGFCWKHASVSGLSAGRLSSVMVSPTRASRTCLIEALR